MKNKIHKTGLLVLVFCLIFTAVASATTISFTDISNSWAKEYIVKAAELGIIKGDAAGTFRPKDNVTMLESLIMLSRLHEIDGDLQKQIENKYNVFLTANLDKKYSWSFKELSNAIALNIVTQDAVKELSSNGLLYNEASREQVAVLIVKAMGLKGEADNLEGKLYTLPFADASDIKPSFKPYIYIAHSKGILSGDNNKVNPKSNITREQFAKMVCVAYDYVKDNNYKPKFEDFETYSVYKGTIKNITINSIESYLEIILDDSNESRIIRIVDGSTVIKVNKEISKLSKLEKGMTVECKVSENTKLAKEIVVDTSVTVVEGTIKSVYYSAPMKLIIKDKKDVEQSYIISDNVIFTLDGKNTEYKNLVKNDNVLVKLIDNVVTRVDSISRLQTYSGKIKDIIYDFPIKLLLEDTTGKINTFVYKSEPIVTRNGAATSFDQLRVSDTAIVKTEYDVLTGIDATSVAAPTDAIATIKEIKIGNSSSLTLQNNDGEINEYKLSNTAKISVLNSTSTVYDLRVGFKVSVVFSGSEIISIEADETETSQKIMGKIVYTNYEKKMVMLQVENALKEKEIIQLSLDSKSVIMNLSAQPKRISDLTIGSSVICIGSYSGGTFNAISVIIE